MTTTDKKVYQIRGDLTRPCSPIVVQGKEWFNDEVDPRKNAGSPETPVRLNMRTAKFSPDGPPDALFGGLILCSQAFKDIVEALEPEVHDFVPVTFYYLKKDHPYYVLRSQILEAIDVEASDVRWGKSAEGIEFWNKRPLVPVVIRPELIIGKHLWQQRVQFGLVPIDFISGELRAEIERQGLIHCWEFQEQIVGEPATV